MRQEMRGVRAGESRWGWTVFGAVLLGAFGWTVYVLLGIRWYATHDEARKADAIAIFGAAEYDGRPSPVLRARLLHGLMLYREKLAPLVVTLGGAEVGEIHSEAGVGRQFLLARGIPESATVTETKSRDTRASVARLAEIAVARHLRTVVAVSDGTHLFRIHALCSAAGLTVYTSPRPELAPLPWRVQLRRVLHELLSYTAWKLGLLR